jgi:hypothetical protein
MYLHIEDLEAIMDFMKKFEGAEIVEVTCDSSSGIGSVVTATLNHISINGEIVSVSKVISDVENW